MGMKVMCLMQRLLLTRQTVLTIRSWASGSAAPGLHLFWVTRSLHVLPLSLVCSQGACRKKQWSHRAKKEVHSDDLNLVQVLCASHFLDAASSTGLHPHYIIYPSAGIHSLVKFASSDNGNDAMSLTSTLAASPPVKLVCNCQDDCFLQSCHLFSPKVYDELRHYVAPNIQHMHTSRVYENLWCLAHSNSTMVFLLKGREDGPVTAQVDGSTQICVRQFSW